MRSDSAGHTHTDTGGPQQAPATKPDHPAPLPGNQEGAAALGRSPGPGAKQKGPGCPPPGAALAQRRGQPALPSVHSGQGPPRLSRPGPPASPDPAASCWCEGPGPRCPHLIPHPTGGREDPSPNLQVATGECRGWGASRTEGAHTSPALRSDGPAGVGGARQVHTPKRPKSQKRHSSASPALPGGHTQPGGRLAVVSTGLVPGPTVLRPLLSDQEPEGQAVQLGDAEPRCHLLPVRTPGSGSDAAAAAPGQCLPPHGGRDPFLPRRPRGFRV